MNPLLPPEALVPLLILGIVLLIFSSRKQLPLLPAPWRVVSVFLRVATLVAMGLLALNPGAFAPKSEPGEATAWILMDHSASMSLTTGEDGDSRLETARKLAETLEDRDGDLTLRILPFAEGLSEAMELSQADTLSADGTSTDLLGSVHSLLKRVRGDHRTCRGILILSDGIDLQQRADPAALALAARAQRIPISAVHIGTPPVEPDLELIPGRTLHTVTAKTDRPLHGRIRSQHLEPVRTRLRLKDRAGNIVDETELDLATDTERNFELRTGPLEPGLHEMQLELSPVSGEIRTENNRATVHIHAVEMSLKVLLLEGVPHWDSKFLSQWMRGQDGIELTTLHRLSDNRWFRVDPGADRPDTGSEGMLPGEENEFRNYDVILVGRGLDYLATSRTTAALHAFVREHGGVLVFSRGRPVTTPHPGIESMMPVRWLEENSSDHRAGPAASGKQSGLFGDLLPGEDDPLWEDLPPLRGLRKVRILDGLVSTLMNARTGESDSDPWPVLISRRVGNGRVMMLNGEGMWHWDFRPSMDHDEKWYGHFWSQLLLWVVRSARFQPGMETSVEWTPSPVLPGKPVEFRVRHRLGEVLSGANLRIMLEQEGADPVRLPLQPGVDGTARTRWDAATPGLYAVTVERDGIRETLRHLWVSPPPREADRRIPQEEPLRTLVRDSGGDWFENGSLPSSLFAGTETVEAELSAEAVWHPHWTQPWLFCMIVFMPAAEWALRRRQGLI